MSVRSLGRWMKDAEDHYGLELPKAAKPTRRGSFSASGRKAPVDTTVLGGAEHAAGGVPSGEAPFGGILPSPPAGRGEVPAAPAPGSGGDDSPGAGAPRTSGSATHTEGSKSGSAPPPRLTPTPVAPVERRVVCPTCAGEGTIPDHEQTQLAKAAAENIARRQANPGRNAIPAPTVDCKHPKERRKKLSYMTVCGVCQGAVKPGE